MIFALILGCSFGFGDPDPTAAEAPAAGALAATEPVKPPFDPLPEGVELIMEPARFQSLVKPYELGPSLASHAVSVEFNTAVMVDQMAAVRTGAELGALMVEAGHQDAAVVTARLERIRAGLSTLQGDGPELVPLTKLTAAVEAGIIGDAWVQVLQANHAAIHDNIALNVGDDMVPMILAGAWMQGALLSVQAMREEGAYEAGPLLLRRPRVGVYFESWVEHVGNDIFPQSALTGVRESMATLRRLTDQDTISPEDAAEIQDTLEGLLGMI